MTNCPNCGAPLTSHKCEYCGAIIFDFASIEIGKPMWINFKLHKVVDDHKKKQDEEVIRSGRRTYDES